MFCDVILKLEEKDFIEKAMTPTPQANATVTSTNAA
jgi:hypothetical protein